MRVQITHKLSDEAADMAREGYDEMQRTRYAMEHIASNLGALLIPLTALCLLTAGAAFLLYGGLRGIQR